MKWILALGLTAALVSGCDKAAPPPPAAAPAAATRDPNEMSEPTEAQEHLRTVRLWLGPAEVNAEMALTPKQEQTGLMFRTNLAENDGMIFAFPRPVQASFWMKNCTLPLSCAYITPNGAIAEIHNLEPNNTTPVVASSPNIQYVLEVNQGWFQRHGVTAGTFVRTEHGPLSETFVQRGGQ